MSITIKGIGAVGGFGNGVSALQHSLATGRSHIQDVSLETSNGPISVPALLADTTSIQNYVGKRELRRIDHYIRMALLGSFLALEDAGLLDTKPDRMGIIVATGYGATCNTFDFQHSVITAGDPCGSPTKFTNSVHNAAAAHISIVLRELGPNLSISHFDMSMPSALLNAVQWLEEERVDWVLVGGVDEFCKVLGYYWHCRYNSPDDGQAGTAPQTGRQVIVGEGSCFFVLARENKPTSPYGCIEDVQLGNFERGNIRLPEKAAVFQGADGFSDCEARYAQLVSADRCIANYTALYGALPVGMAFDAAIAALSLQTGKILLPQDSCVLEKPEVNGQAGKKNLTENRICCLKLGAAGAYGLVTLNRNQC